MKKILFLLFISIIFLSTINSKVYAKNYKIGDIIEDIFIINNKFKINLPKGKWILAEKSAFDHYLTSKNLTLVRIENNKIKEAISIAELKTAGVHEDIVNAALLEILFKNKYDGCYEKPEYTVLELYKKGSTHNCFWVGHLDVIKHFYNPDDPELRGANAQLKMWLKQNNVSLPKVALYSEHSYFSRLKFGKWFVVSYVADPTILNAPDNKFIDENMSEYHKYNIDNYPEHKKIMEKWISVSAQRHIDFENSIGVLNKHKLSLIKLSPSTKIISKNSSNDIVNQIKKLNELYKAGIITIDEFEKAKKKLLN